MTIEFRNLKYSPKKDFLLDIDSLDINTQEITMITGGNGSGKSCLLSCLLGDNKFSGTIANRPSNLSIVYQEPKLFPLLSVRKNIEIVGDKWDELKDLFTLTSIEKSKASEISGGQGQRLAIARSLANSPKFILLDESFNQMDSDNKIQLLSDLKNYFQKHSIGAIVVSHDFSLMDNFADHVVVLQDGKIAFQKSLNEKNRKQTVEELKEFL